MLRYSVVLLRLKIGAKTPRVDQPLVGGASFFTFYYLPGLAIVEMVVLNSKSQGGVPIVPGGGNNGSTGLGTILA